LHRAREYRRHDEQDDPDDGERIAAVVAVARAVQASAVPPHHAQRDVGENRNRADQRDCERHDENVVVLHVRQFVGHYSLEFHSVHLVEQPGRHGDCRVLRIAAGRERIRGRIVDHIDARLGQPAGDAQTLNEVVQALVCHRVGRHRATHAQRDRIRLPVRHERSDAREHESDDRAERAVADDDANRHTDQDEHGDEARDEGDGAALVGRDEVVQNFTVGTLAAAASASKYSRSAKLNDLAKMTPGNDCVVLL